MSTTPLPNQLVDVGKDIVKLLVRLALAMTHRELRVDELAADCHLERAAVRGDRGSNRDLAGEFVLDERRQCGSESLVASAASVVDRHHWSTTGVVVLDGTGSRRCRTGHLRSSHRRHTGRSSSSLLPPPCGRGTP